MEKITKQLEKLNKDVLVLQREIEILKRQREIEILKKYNSRELTAEIVRKYTLKNGGPYIKIAKAMDKGKFSVKFQCENFGSLCNTIKQLEKQGFRVKAISNSMDSYYLIEWG